MTRMIAIDWNEREVRYVLADATGRQLHVRAMGAVPLQPEQEGAPEAAIDPGAVLKEALAGERVGRVQTLVGVGRGAVEVLDLSLPPARDEELPELVANQALREVPSLAEDSVKDFLPLDESTDAPRHVTAVIISSEQLEKIKQTTAAAGLKPKRVLLRPYACASLVAQTQEADGGCMLVNRVDRELDLTVVRGGRTTFSRTVRLPAFADDQKRDDRFAAEIGRTLAVASQDGIDSEAIARITILGRPEEYQALADQVFRQWKVPATLLDPFHDIGMPSELEIDDPGRFAPLLGMLLEEARGGQHGIDLLRPRQQPKPPSRRRVVGMAAAVGTAVLLVVGYLVWSTFAEVDAENRQLAKRLSELKELTKKAAKQKEVIDAIRGWEGRNVNWLDELRDLSIRFPSSRDALVLRMTMTAARSGGGAVDLQGLVRDPEIVVRMEQDIRDEFHEVRSKRVQERVQEKAYSWLFETSMFVARRNKEQYRSQLSQETPEEETPPVGDQEEGATKEPPKEPDSRP